VKSGEKGSRDLGDDPGSPNFRRVRHASGTKPHGTERGLTEIRAEDHPLS
jgi:hypothetical protein